MHKNIIKKHFSQKAKHYDENAFLQQKLSHILIEYITYYYPLHNGLILDIGTGTGDLLIQLSNKYSNSTIIGLDIAKGMINEAQIKIKSRVANPQLNNIYLIQADAEKIPIPDEKCNIVVSNATYQWVEDLSCAFREVHRILTPDGKFIFTIFGFHTLQELVQAGSHKVNHIKFKKREEIENILIRNDFKIIDFITNTYLLHYPTLYSLINSLKKIGAGNIFWKKDMGLRGRNFLKEISDTYIKFFKTPEGLKATFETFLVCATKTDSTSTN